MVKPPWGGGAPQSLCSITWQDTSAKRGESGRAGAAPTAVPECRAAAHTAPDLQHPMAVCPCASMGRSAFFLSTYILSSLPPALPGCPLPGAADMSQGRGTQDALWILELSLNSKETLIYALSPRKYFFKRHCSYLGCSYTTASHKWWLSSRRVDWRFS